MSPLRWTFLGLLVLAVLVTVGLVAGPGSWDADRRWAQERYQEEQQATRVGCPVLVDSESGADQDPRSVCKLLRAAAELGQDVSQELRDALEQAVEAMPSSAEAASAEAAALIARLPEGALATLRLAVRREGTPFSAAERGSLGAAWPMAGVHPLMCALLLQARHAQPAAARVDALLDLVAVGVDLSYAESEVLRVIGLVELERGLEAWRCDGWLDRLPVAEQARLARGLALAERSVREPCDPSWAVASWLLALDENRDAGPAQLGYSTLSAWQHGFSPWHAAADDAHRSLELLRASKRAAPADDAWPQRRQRLAELARIEGLELGRGRSRLASGLYQHVLDFEEGRRGAVLQLRLLLVEVSLRTGRPAPELRDPLGAGMLQVERDRGGEHVVVYGADPKARREFVLRR
ncbi:MAG: hypothetical protein AB8H80_12300 [Planctomycetota bacterium]